ncbi:cytosolic carboxypeptidase 2 isoform X1 [Pleurodeles waltl]|uniref:cytosolic carboxypeptidase 2 isoform X1 n=1 Tax=Pleurodeles waltl TaxID=8319 RepID=UPI00370959D2
MSPTLATDLDQEVMTDPYDSFMRNHLQYYGYFKAPKEAGAVLLTPPRWDARDQGYLMLPPESDSEKDDSQKLICSLLLETSLFKSRQIVFDHLEGRLVPRLREPRGLFAAPTLGTPLQPPRWPIECEVIKEEICHIERTPTNPERFYEPTGKETKPQIDGEGTGTIVYQITPATKGSFFTCSRVGGCRGPISSAPGASKARDGQSLQFESRFESGNLQRAVQVGKHEYELTLRTDLYTSKHTQWFYFQVKKTRKGVLYRFTITNLMKSSSLYSLGMKPLLYSQTDAQTRGVGWRREGGDIRYYKNPSAADGPSLYCLTWTCQFPNDDDTCYFAHCYPYTYSDLQHYLQRVANDPVQSQYCKLRPLCRSLAGNTVYLLTITSPSQHYLEAAAKKAVVVTARVHPGETNGSWMMQGFLDFILSNSPDAHLLRGLFIFKVVPMLNPDGVIVGNYRCSLAGRDMNRNYRTMLKDSFPCVWHTRAMVKKLLSEREVLLYCDFHGHSRKSNVFMYGCNNKHQPTQQLHERVFPLMLGKNAPDQFSFQSCKFKVQKSKEGTGRIVMWKMGIGNSYTMESTFGGSTLGSKKGVHFTTEDLKSMGHHFCDTLLDYCDPDSSKFVSCLVELKEILQKEICRKLAQLGQDISNPNLSDVSLSDIESSTSGSNSSESDGLPAHLLVIAQKFKQKKKRLRSRKERNKMHRKWKSSQKANQQENVMGPPPQVQRPKDLSTSSPGKGESGEQQRPQKLQGTNEKGSEASSSLIPRMASVSSVNLEYRGLSKAKQVMEASALLPAAASSAVIGEKTIPPEVAPDNLRLTYVTGQRLFYQESDIPQGDTIPAASDTFCHRHLPLRSQHQQPGPRHPLVITVIQHPRKAASSRQTVSPIKQHPPPFDPLLSQPGGTNQESRKDRSWSGDPPVTGTQPSSSITHGAFRKVSGTPSSWTFGAIPSQIDVPKAVDTGRVRQESLVSLVSSGSDSFPAFPQKRARDPADTQGWIPAASTLIQPLSPASVSTRSSEHLTPASTSALSTQRINTAFCAPRTLDVSPKMKSNPLNAEDSSLGTPGVSSSSLVPQSSLSMESTDQRERPKNLGTWKPEISATPKSVSGRAYQLPRSTGMHRSDSEDKIRSTSKEANPITKVPQDSIASAKIIKSALMEAHTKLSANIIKNTLKDASSVAGADIIRSSLKDSGSITGPMDFSSKTLAQKDPLCIINTPKNATRTKCAPKDATGFSPQKSKEQAATAMDPSEKQRAQAGIRPSLLETLKHQLSTLGEDSDSDEQQDHP